MIINEKNSLKVKAVVGLTKGHTVWFAKTMDVPRSDKWESTLLKDLQSVETPLKLTRNTKKQNKIITESDWY